jgi:pyruvate dehydrogenase E2 component (dihydrolipoamide acetyltransferase)
MYGVKSFSAIINPPQSAILAVGAAETRVVPNTGANSEESPYKTAQVMSVTMSCDHRVVDGAMGAKFLQTVRELIEDPMMMIA